MNIIKTILIIIFLTALTIKLKAVTLTSTEQLNQVHQSFQEQHQNYQNYEPDITLSEIIYDEQSTKGLMSLIISQEEKTFKTINYKKFIQDLYKRKIYRPIWFNHDGIKQEAVNELFVQIESDNTLERFGKLKTLSQKLKKEIKNIKERNMGKELMLDLKLSSLYRRYMGHHLYGSIQWRNFKRKIKYQKAAWETYNPNYNIADMLLHYKISDIVARTTPSSFKYNQLSNHLSRLRKVQAAGGWRKIPASSQLRYGKAGKQVSRLIARLRSEGDYTCQGNSNKFGPCLKKAIKRFQKRHQIGQTGTINNTTRRKLNISVNWKIKKLLLNLDRIKRMPDQAEDRYIMVNIPDYRLYYKENGRNALTMAVIVGDKKHHTPIFSNKVSFIVLNPYWFIPDSIVKKEIIPGLLKDPNYLANRGYEVRRSYSLKRPPINTSKIDWARVLRTGQTKKYKFMQPPGPRNALGKIKFKFPNKFAVYLHDTPNRKLFKKYPRAFSHGCVRIANPNGLLATFAKHERSVNYNRSKRVLRGKVKTQLNLANPVPVHITYLTARIKSDGLVHYLPDVYGYDALQRRSID